MIKSKIFMLADWRPGTQKSNEISWAEVFAEHEWLPAGNKNAVDRLDERLPVVAVQEG